MVKIVTNKLGSNDWLIVVNSGQVIFEGPNDERSRELEEIIRALGHEIEMVSVTDKEMFA